MSARPSPRPAVGEFFERFYLMGRLGEGGMSEVFLAYDLFDPRPVALKFLQEPLEGEPRMVARMRREGEIYRSLRHPCVVQVLEQVSAPGIEVYLVLEVIRGRPLDAVLDDLDGPLPVPRAVRVLEDAASALNAAHRKEIIHRDVKPQNLMVGPDDRATVLDFGIAHAVDQHSETISDRTAGTMIYAAPEQRRGEEPDHRSDIYGLGATLYEVLTAHQVMDPKSYDEMILFRASSLPPPSELNPAVPPTLDRICRRMLADDPAERYPELRDLLVELGMLRIELEPGERRALFGDRQERALDQATKALREGAMEDAERLAAELTGDPEPGLEAEIHHTLGRAQSHTGKPGHAVRSFQRALALRPEGAEVLVDLVLLRLRLGAFDEAVEDILGASLEAREHPMVAALLELLRALDEVPGRIRAAFTETGPARAFQRAVKRLH